MKKILIGSLVGAVILFVWGFLSWAILPMHLQTYMYTPAQDSILKILEENNLESGAYLMPMADNRNVTSSMDSKYHEEMERVMAESKGKPMASVFYLREGHIMNSGTMLRGFFFCFLATLAASIVLFPGMMAMSSFFGRWWLALMVGLLITAAGPLIQFNWMGIPWNYTVDMIMDHLLNWSVLGLWFAYYFKSK
jgi:hypothetical protein